MKIQPKNSVLQLTPYVPGKPIEETAREYGLNPDEIVKIASNENPLGVSPKAVEAMKKIIDKVNIYPDGASWNLRKKIAAKLGVEIDNVIAGSGSDELIIGLALGYINPTDEIITSKYSFVRYINAAQISGANLKLIDMKEGWKFNLEAILDAITDNTKIIYIANPNNPTGTIVEKEELLEFLEKVPENVLVVLDEAYYEFASVDENYPDGIEILKDKKYQNLIVFRTFAKAYGLAGLRVGYAVAMNTEIIDILNRVRGAFNVNLVAQVAAIAALDDEEFVEKTVKLTLNEKERLYKIYEELQIDYVKSWTNFIFMDLHVDIEKCFEKLLQKGVIIRPMNGYGLQTYARVSIGLPEQNDRWIEALKQLLGE